MSLIKKIKIMYTLTFTTIVYIVWSLISSLVFSNEINFLLYTILVMDVFSVKFMINKNKNKIISLIIPWIISIIIMYASQSLKYSILNGLFILSSICFILNKEEVNVNHTQYKYNFTKAIYILIILSPIVAINSPEAMEKLFRMYVICIVFITLTIREAMAYEYNLKRERKDHRINLSIVGISIIISQQFFYEIFMNILDKIFTIVNYGLDIIVQLLITVIGYPIGYLILLIKSDGVESSLQLNIIGESKNIFQNYNYDKDVGQWVNIIPWIFKAIFVIVIIIMVIKFIRGYQIRSRGNNEQYEEFVEKIDHIGTKDVILNNFKKLFKKKLNSRDEIIFRYAEFVKISYKKKIFKSYMTPNQLQNIVKISIKNDVNMEELTCLYNKAKFSCCNITEEDSETVKNAVKLVKEELK